MKLVYFGKKRPKVIKTVSPEMFEIAREEDRRNATGISIIPVEGKKLTYKFEPFKEIDVDDEVALILLKNAGDLFKRLDKDAGKPLEKPKVTTDGYVGDVPAERIKNLDKVKAREKKSEEGKSIEDIIKDNSKKKDQEEE